MDAIEQEACRIYVDLKKQFPWENPRDLWQESKELAVITNTITSALTPIIRAYWEEEQEKKRRHRERLLGYHPRRRYLVV
jgi:hypothetical protein